MEIQLNVVLETPLGGERHTLNVSIDDRRGNGILEAITSAALYARGRILEVVNQAARDLAASNLDFEAVAGAQGDSAYLDALDKMADSYIIVEISKVPNEAMPRRRYRVDGIYSDYPEGGTWSDHVEAIDEDDAEFAARFQMALNEQSSSNTAPTVGGVQKFLSLMADQNITCIELEPLTIDEAIALIRGLQNAGREMISAYGNCGTPRQQKAADDLAAAMQKAHLALDEGSGGDTPQIAPAETASPEP